jgi:hypothetical protein
MVLGALLMSAAASFAQTDQEAANQFWGIWRMVSRTQRLADGTTRPYPNNVGYIVYTEPGYMCYAAMNPNRALWKSASPTPEEAQSAITGLNAYCASVEVHAKEGFILHHVEVERVPNDVGKIRKRWFTFEGPNRVVFRIDSAELSPPVVEDTLVWERVQKR